MLKYIKSFIYEKNKEEHMWISGLIMFVDDNKMILDRGFITENISDYSFYCQFNNFTLINGELHYMFPDSFKKIDSNKVYLHLRIGKSPFEIPIENPTYWNLFFTNPNNKIYKNIELVKNKIKIQGLQNPQQSNNKEIKIQDLRNPLFLNKQIYDESSVLFSFLDISKL